MNPSPAIQVSNVSKSFIIPHEPINSVRGAFQEKCREVFLRLKSQGKTIVLVSHGMAQGEEFCDRVAVSLQGRLAFLGDPAGSCGVRQAQRLTAL